MGLFDSLFGSSKAKLSAADKKRAKDSEKALSKAVDLGNDYLSFAKDQFKVSQERQQKLDALTSDVSNFFLNAAKSDRATYENVYRPIEQQFAETAKNYASPERQEEAAAQAAADVQTQAAINKGASDRAAFSMGVNPASGRYAGIDRAIGLGTALASVDAQNKARQAVRDKALALQEDAINMGRNANTAAISEAGQASTPVLAANTQWQNTPSIVQPGYNAAINAYGAQAQGLGNLYNAGVDLATANAKLQQAEAEGAGKFLGKVAGAAIPLIFSDKRAKASRREMPEGEALAAVKKMPVETYRYKAGVADGGAAPHVGPMAQDFKSATGKGDGTTIPMQDAIGITMGAVKDLAKKVDRIMGAIGIGSRPIKRGVDAAAGVRG